MEEDGETEEGGEMETEKKLNGKGRGRPTWHFVLVLTSSFLFDPQSIWPGQQNMSQQTRTDESPEVREVRTFLWLPSQELQPEASILVF